MGMGTNGAREMKTPEELAAAEYARSIMGRDYFNARYIETKNAMTSDFLAGIAWRDANPKRPADPHGRGKWNVNE